MSQQLTFDWPVGVSLGAADFFVSDANAAAYAMLTAPEAWPEGKLVLVGPEGSGKSHLARMVETQIGAVRVSSEALGPEVRADAPVIVEDADRLPRDREEVLFHLHNNLRSAGQLLLMTARRPPARWDVALPDLASRVQATATVEIAEPDDALLQVLILKLFSDRQILPPPDLAAYLAPRIERSFAAAAALVERLDRAALAEKRPITKALARGLLDNGQPGGG